MTPLRIEAVYERVPLAGWSSGPAAGAAAGAGAAAVRWGVRASFARADSRADADAEPEPARAARGPRRGPREIGSAGEPAPFPDLLAYGPNGGAIPLPAASGPSALRGASLDRYA